MEAARTPATPNQRRGPVPTAPRAEGAQGAAPAPVATPRTHLPLLLRLGQLHLLQHLGPLLHDQRLLVGEGGDVVLNLEGSGCGGVTRSKRPAAPASPASAQAPKPGPPSPGRASAPVQAGLGVGALQPLATRPSTLPALKASTQSLTARLPKAPGLRAPPRSSAWFLTLAGWAPPRWPGFLTAARQPLTTGLPAFIFTPTPSPGPSDSPGPPASWDREHSE